MELAYTYLWIYHLSTYNPIYTNPIYLSTYLPNYTQKKIVGWGVHYFQTKGINKNSI